MQVVWDVFLFFCARWRRKAEEEVEGAGPGSAPSHLANTNQVQRLLPPPPPPGAPRLTQRGADADQAAARSRDVGVLTGELPVSLWTGWRTDPRPDSSGSEPGSPAAGSDGWTRLGGLVRAGGVHRTDQRHPSPEPARYEHPGRYRSSRDTEHGEV